MNEGKTFSVDTRGTAAPAQVHDVPASRRETRSLCVPDPGRSCFGCCPPIRPAHYDPLDWVSSLKREFREHRELFAQSPLLPKPIVGFSCWALGYLDADGLQIGCLLHPARHAGQDLRHLTGYMEKCARERCLQAKHFDRLSFWTQSYWLGLTEGLGSFYYSSPKANPLFHLLLWGPAVLEKLAALGRMRSLHVTELVHQYPFLIHETWNPRGHRFLMETILEKSREAVLPDNHHLEETAKKLHEAIGGELVRLQEALSRPPRLYVHRAGLSDAFADYLRGVYGIMKANSEGLCRIRERACTWVQRLTSS